MAEDPPQVAVLGPAALEETSRVRGSDGLWVRGSDGRGHRCGSTVYGSAAQTDEDTVKEYEVEYCLESLNGSWRDTKAQASSYEVSVDDDSKVTIRTTRHDGKVLVSAPGLVRRVGRWIVWGRQVLVSIGYLNWTADPSSGERSTPRRNLFGTELVNARCAQRARRAGQRGRRAARRPT